jgi:hypothetical protein
VSEKTSLSAAIVNYRRSLLAEVHPIPTEIKVKRIPALESKQSHFAIYECNALLKVENQMRTLRNVPTLGAVVWNSPIE